MFKQIAKNIFKLVEEDVNPTSNSLDPLFSFAAQSKYIINKNIDVSSIILDYTNQVKGGMNENHEYLVYELLNHFKPVLKEYGVILNFLNIYNIKKISGFHIGGNLYLKNTPISKQQNTDDIKNSLPYLKGNVII